jgi:two-component sensor histidine kinase
LERLKPGRFALFADASQPLCAAEGLQAADAPPRRETSEISVEIGPAADLLRVSFFDGSGRPRAYGEYSRDALARIVALPGTEPDQTLILSGPGGVLELRRGRSGEGGSVRSEAPLAGDALRLELRTGAAKLSATEVLATLLPILMWLAASLIGWLIVDRLLLRPLGRMHEAIAAWKPGDRTLDLPTLSTPAQEINALGAAFDRVTRTVTGHEAELEAAVERQRRLVREVHHRVKNNLQVVASLLNLHARGVTNEDVAAAYASIQRRVDALAVVHRNHYAELEENRGVALKPLISELGANLRATAPASAAQMQIRVGIEPFYATQDVAVSVAFLITELVEFAMFCGARAVAVTLEGDANAKAARLTIESDSLKSGIICDQILFDRFDRIVTGLSRQLRSKIERDLEAGRYALDITVVDKADK